MESALGIGITLVVSLLLSLLLFRSQKKRKQKQRAERRISKISPMVAYEELVGEIESLRQELDQEDRWSPVSATERMEVFSRVNWARWSARFRAEAIIDIPFEVLYNILLQPSLALEWDPTLAGSRLLGCFYQDQTVVNILQLCYRTIPGTFGSFLKNPKVQLCRAAWRNQNSTEAIILMKSLKTPSLPAQITVSTFAFQLKVIDGKSCLLTHVLDQSSRGLSNLFVQRTLSLAQVKHRLFGLSGAFQSGPQIDSFMLADKIRETNARMLHLAPGFRVVRETPLELKKPISGKPNPATTAAPTVPKPSNSEIDFEPPDPKALVEVLIPNRGRGLILISQGKDFVKSFLAITKLETWAVVETSRVEVVEVSKSPMANSKVLAVMGKTTIAAPPKVILAALLDVSARPKWDPLVSEYTLVEKINTQTKITHTVHKPSLLISSRDYVTLESWEKLADGTYVFAFGEIAHKTLPEQPNHIRGRMNIGGFAIKATQASPPQCEVTYLAHYEQMGNMVPSLENYNTTKIPLLLLTALQNYLPVHSSPVQPTEITPTTPTTPIAADPLAAPTQNGTYRRRVSSSSVDTQSSGGSSSNRGSFSPKEQEAIAKLRKYLQDILPLLPPFRGTDLELSRWLAARRYHVEQAEAMFRNSMKWRQENRIDQLEDYQPPQILKQYWPSGVHRQAKDGSVLYIDNFGQSDFVGLAKATSRADIIKYQIYLCEKITRQLHHQDEDEELGESAGGAWDHDASHFGRVTLIQNLEGLSSRQLNGLSLSLFQEVLATIQNNYPERLKKAYVVNATYRNALSVAWQLFKFSVDSNTARKIEFLMDSATWRNKLLEVVSPENLPQFLGGACREPDEHCSAIIGRGGLVPAELYRVNDPNLASAEIAGRGNFQFKVNIEQNRTRRTLRWEFATEGGDITFAAYLVSTKATSKGGEKEKRKVVIEEGVYPAHLEAFNGELECNAPGELVFEWGNAGSFFRRRVLKYRVAWKK